MRIFWCWFWFLFFVSFYTGWAQFRLHTYIHTCIHTYIHTYMHTYIHSYIHTYMPTYVRAYARTHIYTGGGHEVCCKLKVLLDKKKHEKNTSAPHHTTPHHTTPPTTALSMKNTRYRKQSTPPGEGHSGTHGRIVLEHMEFSPYSESMTIFQKDKRASTRFFLNVHSTTIEKRS